MRISLKLLVDTKANKVLFAEATKDFVDFIFQIMCMPLGTVVNLLTENKMVGCLGDLYKSVSSLNTQYFQSDLNKHYVIILFMVNLGNFCHNDFLSFSK